MHKQALIKTFIFSVPLAISIFVSLNYQTPWVWILLPIALFAYYIIESYELRHSDEKKVEEIMNRLCSSVSYLEKLLDINLRSHISLLDNDGKLRIKYQHNMDSSDDLMISLSPGQGCMGLAWNEAKAGISLDGTFCDLTIKPKAGGPKWVIPPKEQNKVSNDLKWIFTVPITIKKQNINTLYALLTIDGFSPLPINEDLSTHEFRIVRTFAKTLAFIISKMLYSMRQIPNSVVVDT